MGNRARLPRRFPGDRPLNSRVSYLLDTNVISEARKSRPHPDVLRFLQDLTPSQTFISVMTLGELRKGVANRAKHDLAAAQATSQWIDGLEDAFEDRILLVDRKVTRLWGELSATRSRPVVDTLLAATAILYGLTLVTRNTRDVSDTPATLFDPWPS